MAAKVFLLNGELCEREREREGEREPKLQLRPTKGNRKTQASMFEQTISLAYL